MQDEREEVEKITFMYAGIHTASVSSQNVRFFSAMENVKKELSTLNLNRGGKNTSGFVFENLHVADKNRQYLQMNTGDVLNVIDDNGIADFSLIDINGNLTYQQAKMGYHGSNKYKITKEKYGEQLLVTDKGNKEFIEFCERRGIAVEESNISKEVADRMTTMMKKEGKIRSEFSLSNTAPITANLFAVSEQLKYAHAAGIKSARGSAAFAAGISFGKNMYEFMEGNAELRDVLLNTAKDTVIAAGNSYIVGSVGYLSSGILANSMVANLATQVTSLVVSTEIGATIVSLGPIITTMSAAAGPAFIAGMVIGTGYAVIKSIKAHSTEYKRKMSQLNRVLNQVLVSMETAYSELDQMIKSTYSFWNQSFAQGFSEMKEAIMNDNFEKFSAGLDVVLKVFGENVLFKNMEEFDEFFFDDDAVLTL